MPSLADVSENYTLFRGYQPSADCLPKKVKEEVFGGFLEDYRRVLRNFLTSDVVEKTRDLAEKTGVASRTYSEKPFFIRDIDAGINGAVGNSFAYVRPGEKGSPFRIVVAHSDVPSLRVKAQPVYIEAEKACMGRNVALATIPFGGIRVEDWLGRSVKIVGRIYENERDRGRRVALDGRIEQRSVHTEDSSEMKLAEYLRAYTEARTIRELYNLLGIKDSMDFGRAELYVFPREVEKQNGSITGNDLMGFGQDDRSCLYAAVKAISEVEKTKNTLMVFGLDREEIGSTGNTGAFQGFFESAVEETLNVVNGKNSSHHNVSQLLNGSLLGGFPIISADVDVGMNDQELGDTNNVDCVNAAKLGWGFIINAHDAEWELRRSSPRHQAGLINLMTSNLPFGKKRSRFQICGSVHTADSPYRGGTMANQFDRFVPIVDMGIPVSGLHSPNGETLNLFDLYWLKEGLKVYMKA